MILFVVALFAAPAPPVVVIAPAAEAVAPVDPARLAEAVSLLDAEGFEQNVLRSSEMTLEASLAGMTEQLEKMLGDAVPVELVAQLRQAIRDHNRATLKAKLPAMKLDAARLYAREFTRDELVRLRQIGTDPVMVKARERNQILSPQMMMIGIRAMRESQPELDATIKALVAEYLKRAKAKPNS